MGKAVRGRGAGAEGLGGLGGRSGQACQARGARGRRTAGEPGVPCLPASICLLRVHPEHFLGGRGSNRLLHGARGPQLPTPEPRPGSSQAQHPLTWVSEEKASLAWPQLLLPRSQAFAQGLTSHPKARPGS